ncbi:hypothetical protein [Streptomyces parvulus]|uniref:hypothetical protein n=1 Tax=Streptomyces parvulus TaxID=146923 RepID=UPI00380BF5B7
MVEGIPNSGKSEAEKELGMREKMFRAAVKIATALLVGELRPERLIDPLCDAGDSSGVLLIIMFFVCLTAPSDRKADSERRSG